MNVAAVIYAAKSTEDKRGSIETQIKGCRSLADQLGWEVVGDYSDEAKSAYHGSRGEGLTAAMKHCELVRAEGADVALIVEHSSRLARGDGGAARHLVEFQGWSRRVGVRILSIDDPGAFPEKSTGFDMTMTALAGDMNHAESLRKGAGVKRGLKRRAARGQSRGGPRPYGYRREYRLNEKNERIGLYVVDDVEAAVIRRIFDEYLAGRGHRVIAAGLAADRAPTATGGPWRQKMVATILTRKLYTGVTTDVDGEEYPGEHEQIITRDQFDEAQRIRKSQARQTGGRPASTAHLMTKGLLKCGSCGHTMYPRHHARSGHDYYYCGGRLELGKEFCAVESLKREEVDDALMRELRADFIDLDATRRQIQERHALSVALARQEANSADQELARAEARLAKIKRGWQDDVIDDAEYAEQRDELLTERDAAAAAAKRARAHAEGVEAGDGEDPEAESLQQMADAQRVAEGLSRASDVNALRALLHELFEAVVYYPPGSPLLATDDPGEQEIIRASPQVAGGVLMVQARGETIRRLLITAGAARWALPHVPASAGDKLPPTS